MKQTTKIILLFLLIASIEFFASDIQAVMVEGENHPSFIGYVADRIVVKFDKAITAQMNNQLMQQGRAGIAMLDRLAVKYKVKSIIKQFPRAKKRMYRGRQIDLSGWHKIRFRKEVDVEKVVAAFKKLPGVIDAQPIGIHAVYRLPNDPYFIDQWHLEQVGGPDIDAPEGWDFETGSDDIVVAVLDTGVQYYHKDLGGSNASVYNPGAARGNMWINWAEASGTMGVDDDGNGFTDDWIGWDFVELSLFDALFYCWADEDCFIPDNDPRDFHGHGTHIAGIISAINNNDYGVTSTVGGWGDGTRQPSANGVKIMPLRIGWADLFDPNLGYVSMDYAAQAFYYAADNGAHAANCSWGSSNSGGLGDAIDYFQAAGGLIFKAAGNSPSGIPDYMGGRADIINVAATGTNDCKASFSNFGNWVDVSAPGIDIWSTWYNYVSPADDFVARFSGTSMASPMALSVAASIWSQNPSWNADQVKQKLFDTADYIDGLSCNSTYAGLLGAGRVNAYIAVGSCEGDLNGDGVVDGRDLADLISEFNCTTDCGFDMTYDDMVNAADMAVFAKDFGRASCP